jgi:hypothetical protein
VLLTMLLLMLLLLLLLCPSFHQPVKNTLHDVFMPLLLSDPSDCSEPLLARMSIVLALHQHRGVDRLQKRLMVGGASATCCINHCTCRPPPLFARRMRRRGAG